MRTLIITLLFCTCFLYAEENKKPNIIYILADDLGYNEVGSYGQKKIKTPVLDKLTAEGMKFTQHYSGSAVCAPTRCMLLSGKHSGHSYIRGNHEIGKWHSYQGQQPLPADLYTIPKMLKKVGYKTACVGKWGLGQAGSSGDPNKQGFDLFYGYNCQRHAHNYYPRYLEKNGKKVTLEGNDRGFTGKTYAPDEMVKEAVNFIKENKDKPFFLYYATPIPHVALQVPHTTMDLYKGKWPETPYNGKKGYLKHPTPRAAYAGMVTHMDANIGKLIAELKKHGIYDNTIIIFSSDNGPTFNGGSDSKFFESNKPFSGLKCSIREGGIRVPMIAVWKGKIKAGSTTDHISAQWDVMATLAEITGAKAADDTNGISFAPTLLGKGKQKQHTSLYWQYGSQQALRMGDWKIYRPQVKRNPDKPVMLFNLKEDPAEQNDVAKDHPELVKKMIEVMNNSHSKAIFPKWDMPKAVK